MEKDTHTHTHAYSQSAGRTQQRFWEDSCTLCTRGIYPSPFPISRFKLSTYRSSSSRTNLYLPLRLQSWALAQKVHLAHQVACLLDTCMCSSAPIRLPEHPTSRSEAPTGRHTKLGACAPQSAQVRKCPALLCTSLSFSLSLSLSILRADRPTAGGVAGRSSPHTL